MTTLSTPPLTAWGIAPGELMVIAGPCSAESREQVLETARGLAPLKVHVLRAGVWKPRTRPGTFEGAGAEALAWVKEAGTAIGRPVAVEVATTAHIEAALKAGIDMLWIGARTSTNPIQMSELAETLRGTDVPVLVKNPINPDVQLWLGAIERLAAAGVRRLAAIHRGFSIHARSAYRNDPIWRIPLELRRLAPGLPLLCDPSHISGTVGLIEAVAQNALDLLFDGLMIEAHCNPAAALSDAQQQLSPADLGALLGRLVRRNPSSSSDEYRARISALRLEMDEVDHALIGLLASRMSVAKRIAQVQKSNNVAAFQPDRWRATLESRTREGVEKGLDREFMEELYTLIHEEALRHKTEMP